MLKLFVTALFAFAFVLINIHFLTLITHAIAGVAGGLLHLMLFFPVVFGSIGLVLVISYNTYFEKVES